MPPGLLRGLPKLKFLHLKDNLLGADGLAFGELDTDPNSCQLRVFEVDGNPDLVAAAPDKIAAVAARLVKSWTFASGAGNGGADTVPTVDLSSSKFGGTINVSDQTSSKDAPPPPGTGPQTASV